MRLLLLIWTCCLTTLLLNAQTDSTELDIMDYSNGQEYEIGGVKVTGTYFSDENAVIGVTGLKVGDKIRIPGYDIPRALRNLWRLRLFTNVEIVKERIIGDVIFLEILVQEQPRLSRYSYRGVKKSFHEDLNEQVDRYLLRGGIVTENGKTNAAEAIEEYFVDKGYLDAVATVVETPDTIRTNSVRIAFNVDRGERIKIKEIYFVGNDAIVEKKLQKQLKETKEKRKLFASSKFIRDEFEVDKDLVVNFYNKLGYRDARIIKDSIIRNEDGQLELYLFVNEGNQYYFRDIKWKGNSIYEEEALAEILGIESGDVYNQELLDSRLSFSQDGRDISSLYLDNGYLFFNATPIETTIEEDSIDLEIRIFEGPQATVDKVVIAGNDRTHEHVIRRELRTRPGEKFSRTQIIRSQRQIMNLNYFNPETMDIATPVNPDRGTVDIQYKLEEKPSDQLELSAGWGGNRGVIGTLGVTFNNFSLRNLFNKEAWHPLPQGDGQRLSLRAQTNGRFFQSYNASFTDPWLGGKKPTSFTVAGFYNRFNLGTNEVPRSLNIIQGSVTLGTRLKWPDDNFVFRAGINLQTLELDNWTQLFVTDDGSEVTDGFYNNFSLSLTVARSTISDPLFPKSGSNISLTARLTPPYSLFSDRDYANLPADERFRWLEYHKWRFDAEWYATITGNLVFKAAAKIGLLGFYDSRIGTSPFERFQLGGDGINNQQFGFQGVDIISLRGYGIEDLPNNFGPNGEQSATPAFDKFTLELRYPLSTNPSSTIYVLAFAQGGNAWRDLRDFNPFDFQRSYGAGVRIFLPMFGTLGFDYGIGIDKPGERSLENLATFNIVLGFEPE